MDQALTPLWERLAAFAFDEPGADWTFSQRLARENRWGAAYTDRVITEYRRFVFLAMAAGHPVTPSDGVDQAWHLHLTYTRSYWDDLCGAVLGRPLHHGPTRGGAAESAKFHDWYARTLDSYRRIFGAEPPADIWPPAEDRFGRDLHFARVNTQTHWVVPRPATLLRQLAPTGGRLAREVGLAVLIACACLVAVGCGQAGLPPGPVTLPDLSRMDGREFLRLYVPLALGAVALSVLVRWWLGRREAAVVDPEFAGEAAAKDSLSKFDPYALILLVQGPGRTATVQAAVTRLVDEGLVDLYPETGRLAATEKAAGRPLHPVERAVYEALQTGIQPTAGVFVQGLTTSRVFDGVEDDLRAGGWIQPTGRALAMRLVPLLPLAAALWLGAWRIQLGLERQRPVGFLVAACVPLLIVAVAHVALRPWRTRRGAGVVEALGQQRPYLVGIRPEPSDPVFPMAFALLGLGALPTTEVFASLRQHILPPSRTDGGGGGGGDGGGGGGGDGGGGCGGGGCGGCGGCGGG